MECVNEVRLVGFLDDKSVRPAGKAIVANFTIFIKGDKFNQWVKCESWDGGVQANLDELEKGAYVEACGEIRNSSWADKKTGEKKTVTRVQCSSLVRKDGLQGPKHAEIDSSDGVPF
jgi:single-stranded DNA-binding protein